jgi:hypothetical protein
VELCDKEELRLRWRHGRVDLGRANSAVCRSLDREQFSREQARQGCSRMRNPCRVLIGCVEKGRAIAREGEAPGGERGCGSGKS